MRVFIITMDDPVQTNRLIKRVISERKSDIIGVAVPKGGRLKLSKGRNTLVYLLSLLLIMGVFPFLRNTYITLLHRFKSYLSKYNLVKDPSILQFASDLDIPVFRIKTPNSKQFLGILETLKPDLIINQSQNILKKELLSIPTVGIINRHNALLPKNRGRLTPFWVLFNRENETGVSIHFVEEGIDSGDIIVQKRFPVDQNETFSSLVRKNYSVAGDALIEAILKLERGEDRFLSNDDELATYNTAPTLKEALKYRWRRLFKY